LNALAAQAGPQIYELSIADARGLLSGAQAGKVAKLPADIEDRAIPGGPKGDLSLRIVRPKGKTGALPIVMYFHGGGWVLGDQDTHDRLVRELASGAEAAVVFVNFTPSPEAHYPVAVEEAYAATQWIAANGASLQLDGARLAVAGDSVGANMAAAVTLLAKERRGPKIAGQVLFYPVTDANFDTGSYQRFAEGYFLSREAMKWFWNHYAPDVAARAQITASPLRATVEQLRGLPPALVITAECDVLRDEGEAYARKLIAADVRVTATRYLGTIHDFVMLNAITDTPAPRGAIAQANDTLRKLFVQ
jgi:acetyl esterase